MCTSVLVCVYVCARAYVCFVVVVLVCMCALVCFYVVIRNYCFA